MKNTTKNLLARAAKAVASTFVLLWFIACAAFETIFLGKSAAEQLRKTQRDDLNDWDNKA